MDLNHRPGNMPLSLLSYRSMVTMPLRDRASALISAPLSCQRIACRALRPELVQRPRVELGRQIFRKHPEAVPFLTLHKWAGRMDLNHHQWRFASSLARLKALRHRIANVTQGSPPPLLPIELRPACRLP